MQVFVLSHEDAYDGAGVLGVFSTAEKAMESPEAEKQLARNERRPWKHITEHGIFTCDSIQATSSGVGLTSLIVEPYEVQ